MILKNITFIIPEGILNQNIRMTMWLDLINWIPWFFLFIFSQKYLKTLNQRISFSKFLIAGSIPFFISCILQSWFNLYGPYETLNGLIVWFQKPLEENHNGIAGLFSNQNYAGLWLTAILPLLIVEQRFSKTKLIPILFILIDVYLILLTTSKNAFFGLTIIIIMLFSFKSKIYKLISVFLASYLLSINLLTRTNFQYISYLKFDLFEKISSFNFFNSSRFEIFKITINLISKKPILGWGKSLFPDLYISNGGDRLVEHTHSMPLEIAFNYGLPVSILLIVFVFILILKSWRKTKSFYAKNNTDFINKCWIISAIVIVISHLNDITYYDGKIIILCWILLSGVKCITNDNSIYETEKI